MEKVTIHFVSNRIDKTHNVTHLFSCNGVETVPELFPSNWMHGECNGEIREHSVDTLTR